MTGKGEGVPAGSTLRGRALAIALLSAAAQWLHSF